MTVVGRWFLPGEYQIKVPQTVQNQHGNLTTDNFLSAGEIFCLLAVEVV